MKLNDKIAILDTLSAAYGKMSLLQMKAEENGFTKEAEEIKANKEELKGIVDKMRGSLYEEWIKSATKLPAKLDKSVSNLNNCLKGLEKDANMFKKIVKASNALDDVVITAAKIMA